MRARDLAATEMAPRLMIYESKAKLIVPIVLGAAFVLLGCYLAMRPRLASKLLGGAVVVVCGLGVSLLVRRMRRNEPAVVIDERGIEDRRRRGESLVPWRDITAIERVKGAHLDFLNIRVRNPQAYMASMLGAMASLVQSWYGFDLSPVVLSLERMSHSLDDVWEFIAAGHPDLVREVALGERRPT